jgi:hypothetical protein
VLSDFGPNDKVSVPSKDSYFSLHDTSGQAVEPTETPVQWAPGSLSTIKAAGHSNWHSLPYSVQVRNTWYRTSYPSRDFMERYLIKHNEEFNLALCVSEIYTVYNVKGKDHRITCQEGTEGRVEV